MPAHKAKAFPIPDSAMRPRQETLKRPRRAPRSRMLLRSGPSTAAPTVDAAGHQAPASQKKPTAPHRSQPNRSSARPAPRRRPPRSRLPTANPDVRGSPGTPLTSGGEPSTVSPGRPRGVPSIRRLTVHYRGPGAHPLCVFFSGPSVHPLSVCFSGLHVHPLAVFFSGPGVHPLAVKHGGPSVHPH